MIVAGIAIAVVGFIAVETAFSVPSAESLDLSCGIEDDGFAGVERVGCAGHIRVDQRVGGSVGLGDGR